MVSVAPFFPTKDRWGFWPLGLLHPTGFDLSLALCIQFAYTPSSNLLFIFHSFVPFVVLRLRFLLRRPPRMLGGLGRKALLVSVLVLVFYQQRDCPGPLRPFSIFQTTCSIRTRGFRPIPRILGLLKGIYESLTAPCDPALYLDRLWFRPELLTLEKL